MDSFFGYNIGGTVLLLHINSHNDSQTFMDGNTFTQNYMYITINCHGTALIMYTNFKPAQRTTNNGTGPHNHQYRLTIANTIFHDHTIVSNKLLK